MDVITIGETKYYSIDKFMLLNDINSKKTVYNWVAKGKAIKKDVLNSSFFKLK